ncbi:hypothetical protein GZH44_07580 [Weissella hellenica]|nr:hypothetical protein GZH44_07580 [Weissella hellenica]
MVATNLDDDKPTGYQSDPWSDANTFGDWLFPTIYQYSSHGALTGYVGNLDLDLFYGDADSWHKLLQSDKQAPGTITTTTTTTKKPVIETPIFQYSDDKGNKAYAYTHWEAIAGNAKLISLESPNGTGFELTVDDTGKLNVVKKE